MATALAKDAREFSSPTLGPYSAPPRCAIGSGTGWSKYGNSVTLVTPTVCPCRSPTPSTGRDRRAEAGGITWARGVDDVPQMPIRDARTVARRRYVRPVHEV